MAKHATMIHVLFRQGTPKGPTQNQKRRHMGTKPPTKAISATPAVKPNRKPSDRIWGGV